MESEIKKPKGAGWLAVGLLMISVALGIEALAAAMPMQDFVSGLLIGMGIVMLINAARMYMAKEH